MSKIDLLKGLVKSARSAAGALEGERYAERAAREAEELARLRPRETAPVATKGKSKGPSPKPERAKPKTKAEISAIAERIAPQMTGEFVRGAKGTTNVAGKSRKQWELEKELEHDIRRSREVPEAEEISLEPYKGNVMLSLPGDTSIADYDIFSIGGEGLRAPSRQYGGPRFGLGHPEEAGWASGLEQAAGFQRRVNAASQQYGDVPVLANYLAMGPEGLNYASHFMDSLLKLTKPEQMTDRNMDVFNRIIRSGTPKKDFSDFPGIEHPEAAYLYLAQNPAARKHYNAVMQQSGMLDLGLPSGMNVRHAVTEPELRDLERGMTGFSLLEMQPGVERLKPSAHPTYSHDIPGKFLGRTDILYPYEMTFPDTVAAIRANPKQAESEFGTLQMGGGKQIIDQQLLEELGEYRRRIKELTGKAEGGVVSMADGGQTFPLQRPELVTEVSSRKPKHTLAELLGKGVGAVHEFASKPFGYENPPGEMASSLLGLPAVATTLERFAYGEPLTRGSGETFGLRPETTEALMTALPVAGEAARLGTKGAKALAPTAREMLEAGLERAVEPTRMYAAPPGKPGKVKAPANPVGFYNPAEKAALNLQRKQGPGSAFISDMKKLEQGVNDERIAELGLDQLASKPNVTRDEVVALAEQNRIPLRESVRRPYDETAEYSETESALKDSINYYQHGIRQVQAELERVREMAPTSPLVQQYESKIEAMRQSMARDQERLERAKPSLYGPDSHPDYNMPGGENYREIRVGLPLEKNQEIKVVPHPTKEGYALQYPNGRFVGRADAPDRIGTTDPDFANNWTSVEAAKEYGVPFHSSAFMHRTHHGDEPNVLFHLRVADHVDEEGKRGLLIDELQSDWHQQGREKGYRLSSEKTTPMDAEYRALVHKNADAVNAGKAPDPKDVARAKQLEEQLIRADKSNIPDAPFKDNWYQLGLKRAIKEAVDTGMDRVYLTTGARQADRYDLSKQVSEIHLSGSDLVAYDKEGNQVIKQTGVNKDNLADYIGKEAAKKLLNQEPQGTLRSLTGQDLKVGGEGMKQYYDKTYKNFLEKYAKQHGGKLGMTHLKTRQEWPFPITIKEEGGQFRLFGRDPRTDSFNPNLAGKSFDSYDDALKARDTFYEGFAEPVYYIDLTDAMRNSAKKGQSYKAGGAVTMAEGGAVDYESRFNEMLQKHIGMAEGGAVDYESRFNEMLQKHIGMAEGGEVNEYNSDPDMSDGGLFVPAPAFKKGGAVKSIWKVN